MLLLLDLDKTLLYSDGEEFQGKWFKPRPGLEEFLLLVNQHFQLGIFTTASFAYARESITRLFPINIEDEFIFDETFVTTYFNYDTYTNNSWKKIHEINGIDRKFKFDKQDVVILDDLESARITPLSQVIKAEPYNGANDDVFLYALKEKFEEVIKEGFGDGLDLVKKLGYIAENKPSYHGLW